MLHRTASPASPSSLRVCSPRQDRPALLNPFELPGLQVEVLPDPGLDLIDPRRDLRLLRRSEGRVVSRLLDGREFRGLGESLEVRRVLPLDYGLRPLLHTGYEAQPPVVRGRYPTLRRICADSPIARGVVLGLGVLPCGS
jgi:hypothetical protein